VTGRTAAWFVAAVLAAAPLRAQALTERGFVEARGFAFPQDAPNDRQNLVGDFLARGELFVKPLPWVQFAAGLDLRANTHDQVDASWRFDVRDRGAKRPAISLRRLSATITHRALTIDFGKQFIRWGKADIVTPTDRFAPRDFLNVVDDEFLAVTGARGTAQLGSESFDLVWVPWLTPSRTPLLDQRWTAVPESGQEVTLVDVSPSPPAGSQVGARWGHTGAGYEYSLSVFDGFNHLPNIDVVPGVAPFEAGVVRLYPALRSYGVDAAVPTRLFTIKGETAYFTSSSPETDEYVLYVLQLERQTGEWLIVGGYAGEIVTERRARLTFAPDRGFTRSIVARASYTISANRSAAVEAAVRQDGRGVYVKGEWSQARGQHLRATITGAAIAGDADDFLGQYRRNSHVTLALRYSF
jgi:hypothetical protein